MTEYIIFRDDKAVALVDGDPLRWFLKHTPFSSDHAMQYEGYTYADVDSVALCATCEELIPGHRGGSVIVGTGENPVTVRVHDTDACRKGARKYRRTARDTKELRIQSLRKGDRHHG